MKKIEKAKTDNCSYVKIIFTDGSVEKFSFTEWVEKARDYFEKQYNVYIPIA